MPSPSLVLLRHATLLVALGGERILVDPMLDAAGARGPIADTPQPRDNPLVGLPAGAEAVLEQATAAIVTHLHADHLDDAGAAFLARRGAPVQGQAEDLATLREHGIADVAELGGRPLGAVAVHRTGGRHGHDALADRLGPVSGAVLDHDGTRIYVAGDTVPCPPFADALRAHRPTAIVLNAGGARFRQGATITMTADEVVTIAAAHPEATVVAVHMDAINHCLDTREVLRAAVDESGVGNVVIPADGERVAL
jgi:L-ascorbate metabolism protein UlaG (beta-lactamase superfamily)